MARIGAAIAGFRIGGKRSSRILTSLLMAALVDPYTDERSPAKLSMHRNLKSAALLSPSPRLPWNKASNGIRQTAWHCLGFVGILCAIVGCATPHREARDAADGRVLEQDTARPPRPAVRANEAE